MILYLYGADTFRSRQYLNEQVKRFKTLRDPQGYNVVFVDGKTADFGKILGEINASPFLAEKRMVIVEDVLANKDKELLGGIYEFVAGDKIKNLKSKIENVIIFWQGEALSKVKEAKDLDALLKKEKYAQEFAPVLGVKLVGWIESEVKARGGKIDHEAANYLAQNAGADMWHLNTLIDQLVAYCASQTAPSPSSVEEGDQEPSPSQRRGQGGVSRSITVADIQLFIDEKLDDNIFSLVDAIVQGNRKTAFKLLEHQRQLGVEDGKIFGLMVWQFRILLEMGDLLERENNLTSEAIAKTIGINPFVAKKNLAMVRRIPLAKLQKLYNNLLEIDIKTKTGAAPQDLLIDLFVGRT